MLWSDFYKILSVYRNHYILRVRTLATYLYCMFRGHFKVPYHQVQLHKPVAQKWNRGFLIIYWITDDFKVWVHFFFSHPSYPHQVQQLPGCIAASIKDSQSFVTVYLAIKSCLVWVQKCAILNQRLFAPTVTAHAWSHLSSYQSSGLSYSAPFIICGCLEKNLRKSSSS